MGCHCHYIVITLHCHCQYHYMGCAISNAPKNAKNNLEASYIPLWKPNLNEQKDFERLVLFRNSVT